MFPEGIKTFGASVNTTLGPVNLGAEASVRFNSPLVTAAAPVLPGEAAVTGGRGALFPVGKSAHMQVSAIYVAPRTSVWDSATLMTEIAWNRRLSVKRNPGLIDPNSTRDAINKQAFTALGSDAITTRRTRISPFEPKSELATVPAASCDPARDAIGTARTNATLIRM